MNKPSWDARIQRAEQLASEYRVAAELLGFYAQIARFQKSVFESLQPRAGQSLQPECLAPHFPRLLDLVQRIGPPTLADASAELKRNACSFQEAVAAYNDRDQACRFFPRALLQVYAERLAAKNAIPVSTSTSCCPFCGEKPQVGVLRGEGDGAKRSLVCSLCVSEWDFRRILCPGCGEENKDRLPVYTSEAFPYVRLEACDSCHAYIKSVDLTKDGRAIPSVDEMAAIPLDLWAEECGYAKLETNLLGM